MALKDIKLFNLQESEVIDFVLPDNSNLQIVTTGNNLLQRIAKNFKTAKGSNYFNNFGTDLSVLFGQFNEIEEEYIRSFLSSYLKDYTEAHKKQDEALINLGINLENRERLENIFIEDIVYDYDLNGWIITLSVVTKSQEVFNISI